MTFRSRPRDAGEIPSTWMHGSLQNAPWPTIESWFATLYNVNRAEIDDDYHVWIGDTSGQWLSQDEIDDATVRIDKGI